ncbi:MAG TPA: hypothetical protein VFI65_24580 [Streptosporangiaceae bacterium]|nr:hypothetical protein [Streptosporangiaceae bacterium]
MPDIEPIDTFVGSLKIGVRRLRHSGAARSARLDVYTDYLMFTPFGMLRGIFKDLTLRKVDITRINPSTTVISRYESVIFENPVLPFSEGECIYFHPRGARVVDVLNALESARYPVDRRPRQSQFL